MVKSLVGIELFRTFASAFAQKISEAYKKKEFFERFTQTEVVQEASTVLQLNIEN